MGPISKVISLPLRPASQRIKVPKDAQDVLVEYPARVISVSVLVAVV